LWKAPENFTIALYRRIMGAKPATYTATYSTRRHGYIEVILKDTRVEEEEKRREQENTGLD
jgi:hypothetical protein